MHTEKRTAPPADVFAVQGIIAVLAALGLCLLHLFAPETSRALLRILHETAEHSPAPALWLRTVWGQLTEWFASNALG